MYFDEFNLDTTLLNAIKEAGYETPTPIQEAAIPPALEGRDILGTAQTGTGKTAAFLLPILQDMKMHEKGSPRVLIVTPTRELASQILDHTRMLGKNTDLISTTLYGGVPLGPQIKALKSGVDILIACPGRLLDHLGRRNVRLDAVKVLVIDEADRMFDMGFLPDIRKILKSIPSRHQTMFFSATFPSSVEQLARQVLTDPVRIAVDLAKPASTVSHALYPVQRYAKSRLLLALLKVTDTRSVLIFTRTRSVAQNVAQRIHDAGYPVTQLHSDRTQKQRKIAMDGFRSGRQEIMVATDLASRGLDIERISHVINYDMPDNPEAYIHRIGRTGRAMKHGDAITLVTTDDLPMIHTLERILRENIERKFLENFDYDDPPGSGNLAPEVRALMGPKRTPGASRKKRRRRL